MIARYMTTAEVAETLRLTPWQVLNLIREHRIPATKPSGKWLVAETDLEDYIAAGTHQPQAVNESA